MSLPAILAAAEPTEHGLRAAIPAEWLQGRTSYGGLSSALALTAARRVAGELPPLRSAQVSFVGPLAGAVEATARVLRRGRNATWVATEIVGEAGLGHVAQFVFMAPVASGVELAELPPPAGLVPVEQARPVPPGRGPGFIGNFEVRFAVPRSDRPEPQLCWWLRLRERAGLEPMLELLGIADALPPGVLPLTGTRINVSSMTWLVNLLTPAPATRDGWWLLRSSANYAQAGCSSQDMAAWNADGEPIAVGMQSVALFG